MDHVFAKTKGHGKKLLFKLMSDHTLFSIDPISDDSFIDYDPDHNLDEDAWFKIEGLSKKKFCPKFVLDDFDSKNFDNLNKHQFKDVSFIFSIQEGDFYFQKITPAMFFRKKLIAFGEVAKIEEEEDRIVVNPAPDAIYLKSRDLLIFRNLARISNIFIGIDELYKEATHEEVGKFLSEPFILLSDGFDVQSVSKPNRKRIALVMKALGNMSEDTRERLKKYITNYCPESLRCEQDGKFVITNNSELKNLIYGINERFYTTFISQQKRLANSVQNIG